jgi:hypothetical protein
MFFSRSVKNVWIREIHRKKRKNDSDSNLSCELASYLITSRGFPEDYPFQERYLFLLAGP